MLVSFLVTVLSRFVIPLPVYSAAVTMLFDHIAEEKLDIVFAQWVKQLLAISPERLAMKLAATHLGRRAK